MGQRTQIVVVEDVVHENGSGYRFVTAHHDQWGYGRPVLFDILNIASKVSTGSYFSPRDYSKDNALPDGDVYEYRTLLHHNCPLKEVDEVGELCGTFDLTDKSTDVKDSCDKTALDFTYLFDHFDNNNGGAVVWIVHKEKAYRHKTIIKYGCLIGPEDSDHAFEGFVDGLTYLRKVNPDCYEKSFTNMFNSAIKYFGVRLLDEDDTVKSIIKEMV